MSIFDAAGPTISVVMPAFNHEAYIVEAISSVLSQTYSDIELIVIDDGSTDGTAAAIGSFHDSRLRFFSQTNRGAHIALNRGIELARGKYIAILNSDDAFHPSRLERLLGIAQTEAACFIVTDVHLVDQSSSRIDDSEFWWLKWYQGLKTNYIAAQCPAEAFLAGNFAISSSNFFIRADLAVQLGGFRPYRYILDYEYGFRAALADPAGFRFLIGEKLLNYRLHGANTILENPLKANVETYFFLKRACVRYFGSALEIPLQHISRIKGYMLKIRHADHLREAGALYDELTDARARSDKLGAQVAQLSSQIDELSGLLEGLRTRNQQLSLDLAGAKHYLALIFQSRSYRLGRALAVPYLWIRSRFVQRRRGIRIRTAAASIDELRVKLETAIGRVKVISFDIFDTLLERDLDPPDDVKWIVARNISRLLSEKYGVSCFPETVMELRNQVENGLRRTAANGGMDHECKFSAIASQMAVSLLGSEGAALAAKITEFELRAETDVLFVKNEICLVLEWLKGRGVRVIAVSDMYLDKAHLQNLLERKGLSGYIDEVYVSSERGVGKHSGRLFEHVLETERVQAGEVLHVGDNRHSDYRVPSRQGMHAIHFDDRASRRRRLALRIYRRMAIENPYWRGRHLLQMVRSGESQGFHYDYGFGVLGPIYATFVLGIMEHLKAANIRRVYFLAREGDLFLRLFKVLAPSFFEAEQVPDAHYLYVSRRSTAAASAHKGLGYEPAIVPLFNPKQQGLHSICGAFGLPVEAFAEVSRRHGYASVTEPIHDWTSAQFKTMLADPGFQRLVVKHASESWTLLRQYLAQHGFFDGGDVALVDIGWNGSIQKFFQEAFGADDAYPRVHGLYLGFVGGIKHTFDPSKNNIVGLLCDERDRARPHDIFSRFEEIFEEGARALHATTVGYHRNVETDLIEAIFKPDTAVDRIAECRSNVQIAEFQRGVIDFAAEFNRAVGLTGYGFADIKPFILTLAERAVAYPRRVETSELMQLAHSEDFGYENVMDFRHEMLGSWRAVLRPRKLLRELAAANWKYGAASSVGIPGLNVLLRLVDLLRVK